ncbi:MAG TPA: alkaline phosphatase family protein, partial [Vicinamibacteria bacterium]|nr:alkaline phosphatase family protein [Vicinamibacteria bacterium]
MKIRRTLVPLLAAGAAVFALRLGPAPDARAAGAPRLVLFISVDQMRYDYLTRFAPLYRGGFKTLLERGAIFSNAMYRHGNTETGPGHSVLLSGRNG